MKKVISYLLYRKYQTFCYHSSWIWCKYCPVGHKKNAGSVLFRFFGVFSNNNRYSLYFYIKSIHTYKYSCYILCIMYLIMHLYTVIYFCPRVTKNTSGLDYPVLIFWESQKKKELKNTLMISIQLFLGMLYSSLEAV